MRKGKTYQVIFQIPGVHRKPRVMTAKYLGTDPPKAARGVQTTVSFDLRPEAGTQQIDARHVLKVTEAFGAQVRLPEILREGARVL